jgi:hypothetical protein
MSKEAMFVMYRDGKPVAYRYGEYWVAEQLYVDGGFPTEREAREAWARYKAERSDGK